MDDIANNRLLEKTSGCCRRCNLDLPSNVDEWYERIEISFRGGYGSVFGDEYVVRSTLCQHCIKTLLGEWLEVIPDNSDHQVPVFKPVGAYQPYQILPHEDF